MLTLLAPHALRAQYGMALSPMRIEAVAPVGVSRTGSLTLANDGQTPLRFRTEILDVSIDREAVPQFEKDIPQEAAWSCRTWLTVNPMEGELPPASSMPIRYTFRIPADAGAKTFHCALGFTSLPDVRNPQTTPMGVIAEVRVTCTFYLTIGNPEPTGEVKEILIEKLDKSKPDSLSRAIFNVANPGLTNLRGDGTVEILDTAGKVLNSSAFPTIPIFPERTQRLPFVLPSDLPGGSYKLRARVNLGTGEIQEALLDFELADRQTAAAPSSPAGSPPGNQ